MSENKSGKSVKRGSVLVAGGGVGGMQAALDLADGGFKVYMVEKESSIGGHDCVWVACSSNNHQSSIILRQFQRGYAGRYYYFDALGSDAFLSKLETLLGRRVRRVPVGRPRKSKDHDARGRKVKNNK